MTLISVTNPYYLLTVCLRVHGLWCILCFCNLKLSLSWISLIPSMTPFKVCQVLATFTITPSLLSWLKNMSSISRLWAGSKLWMVLVTFSCTLFITFVKTLQAAWFQGDFLLAYHSSGKFNGTLDTFGPGCCPALNKFINSSLGIQYTSIILWSQLIPTILLNWVQISLWNLHQTMPGEWVSHLLNAHFEILYEA